MKEQANPSPNEVALWVCVWYYLYGVHGFYKLWKRKGLLTSSPFLFGN